MTSRTAQKRTTGVDQEGRVDTTLYTTTTTTPTTITPRSVVSSMSMASGQMTGAMMIMDSDDEEEDEEQPVSSILQLHSSSRSHEDQEVEELLVDEQYAAASAELGLLLHPLPQQHNQVNVRSRNVPSPTPPVWDDQDHNHAEPQQQQQKRPQRTGHTPILSLVVCRGVDLRDDDEVSSISSRGHSVAMTATPVVAPPANNNKNNTTTTPILSSPPPLPNSFGNLTTSTTPMQSSSSSPRMDNLSPLTMGTATPQLFHPNNNNNANNINAVPTPRGIDISFANDGRQLVVPMTTTTTNTTVESPLASCRSLTPSPTTTFDDNDKHKRQPSSSTQLQQQKQRRKRLLKLVGVVVALGLAVTGIVLGLSRPQAQPKDCQDTVDEDCTTTSNTKDDEAILPISAKPYIFQTTAQLYHAIDAYVQDAQRAEQYYGNIRDWNVGLLTDFSYAFASERQALAVTFNAAGVANWDISNAVTLFAMFRGAHSFAQDLCAWGPLLRPTANVTDLLVDTFCETTEEPSFVLDPSTGIYRRLEPWCVYMCDSMN